MNQRPTGVHGVRRPRRLRRSLAALVVTGLALAVVPALASAGASPGSSAGSSAGTRDTARLAAARSCPGERPVQMVEANIRSGMTLAQTKSDLGWVYYNRPDFVALNEVAGRPDSLLAPAGYKLWRTAGRYTGANAVVWRTDRWTAIAQGTIYLTIKHGKTASQTTELGLRYANWATLRSLDGCQTISVVSYHVAPNTAPIGDLLVPSVHKLGGLATYLSADGPVIMAGDLNRHYTARSYPRDLLASYGLFPTWAKTGRPLPTHNQATIDYVFVRANAQFIVTGQVTRDLYSDHNAVVVNMNINSRAPVARTAPTIIRGHVVNMPTSSSTLAKRAVVRRVLQAISLTPRGATLQVATRRLAEGTLYRSIRAAYLRGVRVQFVTNNYRMPTTYEKALFSLLHSSKARPSWAIRRPYRSASGLPPTAVLANRSANAELVGVRVDQPMDGLMALREARAAFSVEKADFLALRKGFARQSR